jgi:hypothetical protein
MDTTRVSWAANAARSVALAQCERMTKDRKTKSWDKTGVALAASLCVSPPRSPP